MTDQVGTKLEKATLQLLWPTSLGGGNRAALDSVTFQFNPKEYSMQKSASWESKTSAGASETSKPEFKGPEPRSMTVEVFLDVTDSSEEALKSESSRVKSSGRLPGEQYQQAAKINSLMADIETLFSCCRPLEETLAKGKTPSPPFVLFTWGKVSLLAFVKQVSVKYTLFKSNGSPVRATASLTLQEVPKDTAKQNPTSGGLTPLRSHTVVAGDSLASIAYAEYGDARLWRALAETNGLDDPMRLPTGIRLLVPTQDSAAAYA